MLADAMTRADFLLDHSFLKDVRADYRNKGTQLTEMIGAGKLLESEVEDARNVGTYARGKHSSTDSLASIHKEFTNDAQWLLARNGFEATQQTHQRT